MRAWEIESWGKLVLGERPSRVPGPGQARVRMRAWSLNYRDVLVIDGKYNPKQALPLIPLSDGVGIVDAIGNGVTRVKIGDRVAPAFAQRWISGPADTAKLRSSLGTPLDGS